MIVYVLVCQSGEYDDYTTWAEAIFESSEQAQEMAKYVAERAVKEVKKPPHARWGTPVLYYDIKELELVPVGADLQELKKEFLNDWYGGK